MNTFFSWSLFLLLNSSNNFQLQNGDLIFEDLDCGGFCEAIEKVTDGYNGANFSHVGIVSIDEKTNQPMVIEANYPEVSLISLNDFLNRYYDANHKPKAVVGRLKKEYQALIPQALQEAKKLLGKKYDDAFDIDNDKYYCSEFIYHIFYVANNNKEIFKLYPMTYKIPNSDNFFPIWVDYFKQLNLPIPEGKPGLNPGGMSRSDKIDIVYYYGQPSTKEK